MNATRLALRGGPPTARSSPRSGRSEYKRAIILQPMLPANGRWASSIGVDCGRNGPGSRDTHGIAAIAGHNDGSMGKFSYSGW